MKTELFISDPHIPYHDKNSWDITLKIAKHINPDIVYFGGDTIDCLSVAHWTKDPNRELNFQDEINQTVECLTQYRDAFPRATFYHRKGNHELRLQQFLWERAKEISVLKCLDLDELLEFKKLHIESHDGGPSRAPHKIGKLNHLHGDELQLGSNVIQIAVSAYRKANVNLIFGHHHAFQTYFKRDLNGNDRGVWVNGCLCALNADYMPVPNWQRGFSIITYASSGYFNVQQVPFFNGKVIFDNKLYEP